MMSGNHYVQVSALTIFFFFPQNLSAYLSRSSFLIIATVRNWVKECSWSVALSWCQIFEFNSKINVDLKSHSRRVNLILGIFKWNIFK